MSALRDLAVKVGWTRLVLIGFLALLWLGAATSTELDLTVLFTDCLTRAAMNGVLVLALVPAVRAGVGLNFGLPLGIVCGLLGSVILMDAGLRGPACFWASIAFGGALGAIAGFFYARLLERVKGDEMMVGIYVGFSAVAGASILWLLLPTHNPEPIWPLGGKGLRNTLVLDGYFKHVLDGFAAVPFGRGTIPTGLLLFWGLLCWVLAVFLRTRLGLGLSAAGANPRFAESSGIDVRRMRTVGVVLSTTLAAVGIVVFSQSYGFVQLYKAPLLMAFPTVAALLIGGASVRVATIQHVVVGTLLFQSVLTTSLPLVNELVVKGEQSSELSNIPEIARLIISNGIILYALTRKEQA
ncbi:MAG: ABC transporter permease [Candidatus Eisenbacteria bacterium]|nr:ABC transporter permease [Candidatus Eisenbacteria bacterium]